MAAPEEKMAPDDSPGSPSPRSGVRRVNNLPMYIVGGLVTLFLLIIVLVASDRASEQDKPAAEVEHKATDSNAFALTLTGAQKDGIIPAAKAAPLPPPSAASDDETFPLARPDNLENPPSSPHDGDRQREQQAIDEAERIRTAKMARLEEAMRSRTSVQVGAPRSSAVRPVANAAGVSRDETLAQIAAIQQQIETQARESPSDAYQARLRLLQGSGDAVSQRSAEAPAGNKDFMQFGASAQEDRWRLGSGVQPPRTRFELRAGAVLPAILISGINSDLPGQIMGQVSQDVFDTATGKWKLIPQGAKVIGRYSSDVAYGQARVLIAWQRIVFPDGKAMDIGSMPGADGAGYSGFKDQVNNHYLRVFSSAILMSGVTAGIALSQPESGSNSSRPTAASAMSEALGQQLGQVTAQLIAKNMNIAPTLEIRPGYRFNIVATKDLTFSKPYQPFDY